MSDSAQLGIGLRCSHGRSRPVNRLHELSKITIYITFQRSGTFSYTTLSYSKERNILFFFFVQAVVSFSTGRTIGSYSTIAFTGRKEDFVGLASF